MSGMHATYGLTSGMSFGFAMEWEAKVPTFTLPIGAFQNIICKVTQLCKLKYSLASQKFRMCGIKNPLNYCLSCLSCFQTIGTICLFMASSLVTFRFRFDLYDSKAAVF